MYEFASIETLSDPRNQLPPANEQFRRQFGINIQRVVCNYSKCEYIAL